MTAQAAGFGAPSIDAIALKGGLDQVTPSLTLGPGAARQVLNFEAAVTGGYTRIAGYERFDGHPSPSEAAEGGGYRYVSVAVYENVPAVGDTLTASGGASGVLAYISGGTMVLTKVAGTWSAGEALTSGVLTIGTINNVFVSPTGPEQDAIVRNAVAAIYRADIFAVPGSGPIRGVFGFEDAVYAFRDNLAGTAAGLYKSTAGGWNPVAFYKTVSFSAGGATAPADGGTLTQGGVTATIKRVVRRSGSWAAGTAAGEMVIAAPAGGNFAAGAATIGGVNVTLAGVQTTISMLPGGRFEFVEANFAGQAATNRVYGCDGKNKAFEFDGDVLVPVSTGAAVDTPTHIAAHRNYLFLSLGSSVMHSAPGLPFDWTALGGAAEMPTGDTVTGMICMPGATSGSTLGITSRSNTFILYGTGPSDWNMVTYDTGSGAVPYSMQDMAQTFMYDDRGVTSFQTSLQYGNFSQSTLTNTVLPFVNEHIGMLTASTLCRRKSQYRLFFSDKAALYITVVNGKLVGCMPQLFTHKVECTYEGKKSDGTDVLYFGSDDGFVYQMEKGTSFDGEAIEFYLALNYSNAKSPRTLKRYRKAALELTAEKGCYAAFDFATVLGYDSAEYSQPKSATYGQYTGQARWDSFTWDNFFWDANRVEPVECELEGTAENIAMLVSGSSNYVPSFTINSILVHYSPRRMMR